MPIIIPKVSRSRRIWMNSLATRAVQRRTLKPRRFTGGLHSRHQQSHQEPDNGDHNQQFYERKTGFKFRFTPTTRPQTPNLPNEHHRPFPTPFSAIAPDHS